MGRKNGNGRTADALGGYEATTEFTDHLVRAELSDREIREYGRRLADNERREIPKIRRQHEEAVKPLREQLETLEQDRSFYVDQLVSSEDGVTIPDADHAMKLAQTLQAISGIEGQVKSLDLERKVALDKIGLDNDLLVTRINLGYEMRPTPCRWYVNWQDGRKALVIDGTREIVLTKPLSPEERQLSLLDVQITDEDRAAVADEAEG